MRGARGTPVALLAAACSAAAGPTRETLARNALESPRLVGLHDREGWLGLFADDGVIEDPVGSPVSGPAPDERRLFWDCFIAPNNVTLVPQRPDIVAVKRRVVVRSVKIDAQFSNGATMRVPVHIVYQFDPESRVKSLRAHWEVAQNKPVMESWADALPAMVGSTLAFWNMIRVRGIGYTWRYLVGTIMSGVGAKEKAAAEAVAAAVRGPAPARGGPVLPILFTSDAVVSFPVQDRDVPPQQLRMVLSFMELSECRAGGRWVSCDFAARDANGSPLRGVGRFEFPEEGGGKIGAAELYHEGPERAAPRPPEQGAPKGAAQPGGDEL
eukprot:TRINITY_DN50929_c0_g1_i1.p2 TRINITY_DN50929_c0_g1~~TRINITY_DN50929_c0_g1_i1.p2  ORF type:complete len:350 (+),score=120.73 TRINITY_DN50929_c0_g1_i1:73-1050(+)